MNSDRMFSAKARSYYRSALERLLASGIETLQHFITLCWFAAVRVKEVPQHINGYHKAFNTADTKKER